MASLYTIDKENKVVIHKEALKLTKHLSKVSQPVLLFIVAAYDYDGLFAQYPQQERIKKASFFAFGKTDPEELSKKITKDAIDEYCALQYSPSRKLIEIFANKIEEYLILLEAEKDVAKVMKYSDGIEQLEKKIQKEQEKIQKTNEQKVVLQGNRELSFIEEWQNNMRAEKKNRAKKDALRETIIIE